MLKHIKEEIKKWNIETLGNIIMDKKKIGASIGTSPKKHTERRANREQ